MFESKYGASNDDTSHCKMVVSPQNGGHVLSFLPAGCSSSDIFIATAKNIETNEFFSVASVRTRTGTQIYTIRCR